MLVDVLPVVELSVVEPPLVEFESSFFSSFFSVPPELPEDDVVGAGGVGEVKVCVAATVATTVACCARAACVAGGIGCVEVTTGGEVTTAVPVLASTFT